LKLICGNLFSLLLRGCRIQLNLDLPPGERWVEAGKQYSKYAPAVIAYFEEFLPSWLLPVIEEIASDIKTYFPEDYAEEMVGVAPALGLKLGDVVMMNLIYQIEHIGLNCSASNNTGPVPNCPAEKKKWDAARDEREKGPGLCTSIVARAGDGQIFHGRNLDWSIPAALRTLMVDVDYVRNGSIVFTASQPVGFIGIMHGVRHDGWTYSLDARGKGGKVLVNLLQALLVNSLTVGQHVRRVMETVGDFEGAITALARGPMINEAYLTVGGITPDQGAIITMGRERAANILRLNQSAFYLLETNYDHWEPVPSYDDRRTPGRAHMDAIGTKGVDYAGMYGVLTQWPTFNHHTDFTIVYSAANSSMYQTYIWPELQY